MFLIGFPLITLYLLVREASIAGGDTAIPDTHFSDPAHIGNFQLGSNFNCGSGFKVGDLNVLLVS